MQLNYYQSTGEQIMKKLFSALIILCVSLLITSTASALIIFNDWSLDLGGINGLADSDAYLYADVDQIGFTGIVHSTTTIPSGSGNSEGYLYATNMIGASNSNSGLNQEDFNYDDDGNPSTPKITLDGFEMTFSFSVDSQLISPSAWTHTGTGDVTGSGTAKDGTPTDLRSLNIYIDNLNDGSGQRADLDTGLGFDDGTLIATFQVLAGDGGSFDTTQLDGHDDATFALVWAETGVFSYQGQDLSEWILGGSQITIGITDSNYDADPDKNDTLDTQKGTNVFTIPTTQTLYDFVATEDGSASFGAVPEPTTMLLLGF
eukprot:TRINITY_DN13637_c0_g1_i1.p1 TRINITY_DN13637_c0_g1~~TRINITY_DN13637_c0_g1_i1.p1  ORF type:complete len:317 (-),score=11.38 TRINITY_DN13637_c0_g1_i1:160-1110(-)